MFFEPQKQFVAQMERHLRGEPLNLDPGYATVFGAWESENKEILYKLSAEERAQSFSDYIQAHVHNELNKLVTTDEQKELAKRGQLLLVSKDGGAHFDLFLTPEEQAKVNPTDYVVLSPTFRSATTNFQELREEQTYLTAITKLREAHYLVLGIDFEKKQIQVSHPKFGLDDVPVNLESDVTVPLMADFITGRSTASPSETQLPEAYGEAKKDSSLNVPTLQETVILSEKENDEQKNKLEKGVVASLAAAAAMQALNANRSAAERAQNDAKNTKENIEKPLLAPVSDRNLPSVMASKNAMAARFARHKQSTQGSQERETERTEQAEAEQDKKAREKQEQEQAPKKQEEGGISKGKAAGIGIGILGSGIAAFGAFGTLATKIALDS